MSALQANGQILFAVVPVLKLNPNDLLDPETHLLHK